MFKTCGQIWSKATKVVQIAIQITPKQNWIKLIILIYPISKDGNCFFRTIIVYLKDTHENYKLIGELIADYVKVNRNQFQWRCFWRS